MSYIQKIFSFFICLICTMAVLSCSSTNPGRKFTPVEADFMLEPGKSIAVISGHNDDNDIQLTEMVIENLTKSGKFKVLSQSDLKKIIPRYPLNVDLIDFSIADNTEKHFTPYLTVTSKKEIDKIQKLVKTDYILIIWIDGMQTYYHGRTSTTRMFTLSRLIAYPGGNIAGYSAIWNEDSDWEDSFKDSSKNLVKEIIKKTKK
ncbi:MAG: hypothetical protein CVV49_17015 [Spirochaetae bacterium HGW-Spirochaetae-5]|nr:MAG: hypothetical protein CVV49_17015 [Spirochaetae bacterium HGW-Spirochaetae-5]